MESLSTQLYAFGIVMLAGISLGVLFDFFRVIRGLLRPGFFCHAPPFRFIILGDLHPPRSNPLSAAC